MCAAGEGTRPLGGKGNPRTANGHRRRELRRWLAAQGAPCHLCGQPIDYSLDWWTDPEDGRRKRHPLSFEVDEIVPVSFGGDPLDRGNVLPAHRICNERRGNAALHARSRADARVPADGAPADAAPQPLRTSREW